MFNEVDIIVKNLSYENYFVGNADKRGTRLRTTTFTRQF